MRTLLLLFIQFCFSFITIPHVFGSDFPAINSDTVSILNQSRISISGSYQRSSTISNEPKSVACVFSDGFHYKEFDSVFGGKLSIQVKGKLYFMRQEKQVWRKSEDLWSIQVDWLKENSKTFKTSLITQLESPLINKYSSEKRTREEGLFLPLTLHFAYGWTFISSSGNWRVDLMITDLRYRRYKPLGLEVNENAVELGSFFQASYRQILLNKIVASFNLNAEFSNARADGYGYRASLKVDWLVWKLFRLSSVSEANRSRLKERFDWSVLAMAGIGFDWGH